jgi:hypothetical protein
LSSRSSRDNVRRFRLRRLDMQLLHSPSCAQHLRWRGSWCLSADAPCCHCRCPPSGWYFAMPVQTLHPSSLRCGRWCHMGQPMRCRRSTQQQSSPREGIA